MLALFFPLTGVRPVLLLVDERTGSGWDGVNFLHSGPYGDVFWICG